MICCNQCGQWYHGSCVSITQEEAKDMEVYVCTACIEYGASLYNLFTIRAGGMFTIVCLLLVEFH